MSMLRHFFDVEENREIFNGLEIEKEPELCGQKAVFLIDEYDAPLAKAFDNGYYDEMINLMRNLLGQALY